MGIPVLFMGAMPTPTFFIPSAGTLAVAGWRGVQLENNVSDLDWKVEGEKR